MWPRDAQHNLAVRWFETIGFLGYLIFAGAAL